MSGIASQTLADRVGRAILSLERGRESNRFNGNVARAVFLPFAELVGREVRVAQFYSSVFITELAAAEGIEVPTMRGDLSYLRTFLGENGRTVDRVLLSGRLVARNFSRFDLAFFDESGTLEIDTRNATKHYTAKALLGGTQTATIPVVAPRDGLELMYQAYQRCGGTDPRFALRPANSDLFVKVLHDAMEAAMRLDPALKLRASAVFEAALKELKKP